MSEPANKALFSYPPQAAFGRPLPKSKLYEKSGANTRLKDLFVSQVDQIVWQYKLAPETINLPARPGVPEVQVFSIHLKTPELHLDVLRCIDCAVQYPIIFELHFEDRVQVIACHKRPSEADASQWVCSDYFHSEWMPARTDRTPLPMALNLGGIYEQLLQKLIPIQARAHEELSALVARVELVLAMKRELTKAEVRLAKEKQFNRKVGLNANLRGLRTELEKLMQ
jgi:hypothetical protein